MDQEISENLPELPSEPPREALIATAVKFLQNPKVADSSADKKQSFLSGKGLTPEEIQIAFTRSGIPIDDAINTQLVAHPQQTVSLWSRLKDYSLFALIVGSVVYGFIHVYKNFIEPLFTKHNKEQDQRLDCIESSINNVSGGIARDMQEIQTNLDEIRQHLEENTTKLNHLSTSGEDIISNTTYQDSSTLQDLKTELASIKGLLLSRKQFPATPNNPPVIPSWQQLKPVETPDLEQVDDSKTSGTEEQTTNSEKKLTNGFHENSDHTSSNGEPISSGGD